MPVTAEIDQLDRMNKPFRPGEQMTLGKNRYRNTGDARGTVRSEVVEVDEDGSVVTSLCTTQVTLDPGATAFTIHNEVPAVAGGADVCRAVQAPEDALGPIIVVLPSETELKLGFRVWGADEDKPSLGPPPSEDPKSATWTAVGPSDISDGRLPRVPADLPPAARVGGGVAVGGVAGGVLAALFGL